MSILRIGRFRWRLPLGSRSIRRSGCVFMVAAVLVGLVTLSKFNRSEPFIGRIRNKIGFLVVGFESIEDNKVGPDI